ncbi:hypothetical protein [Selenomonas caprae]|uniref:hypothetical protein n=1 Tax=Selenomonas caprae TaxID=2606905 RepID=UPI0021066B60|nr:hypothetical protein [Selenomonas caprae]
MYAGGRCFDACASDASCINDELAARGASVERDEQYRIGQRPFRRERYCWPGRAQHMPEPEHEDEDDERNDIVMTLFHGKLLYSKDSLHIIPYGQFTI